MDDATGGRSGRPRRRALAGVEPAAVPVRPRVGVRAAGQIRHRAGRVPHRDGGRRVPVQPPRTAGSRTRTGVSRPRDRRRRHDHRRQRPGARPRPPRRYGVAGQPHPLLRLQRQHEPGAVPLEPRGALVPGRFTPHRVRHARRDVRVHPRAPAASVLRGRAAG